MRSGGRGGHRGVLVGRVSGFDEATGAVEIKLTQPVAEGDVVYLYTPWGQTEPRRLEAGGDAAITLHVRERVAVKDRLFRLAAADVGELGRDLVTGRVALRPDRARDAPERGGGGAGGAHRDRAALGGESRSPVSTPGAARRRAGRPP